MINQLNDSCKSVAVYLRRRFFILILNINLISHCKLICLSDLEWGVQSTGENRKICATFQWSVNRKFPCSPFETSTYLKIILPWMSPQAWIVDYEKCRAASGNPIRWSHQGRFPWVYCGLDWVGLVRGCPWGHRPEFQSRYVAASTRKCWFPPLPSSVIRWKMVRAVV